MEKQASSVRPLLFNLEAASRALSISVPYIRAEISAGRLCTVRLGSRVLIPAEELDRFVDAHRVE
jgi:excisionase family DNA binding protein